MADEALAETPAEVAPEVAPVEATPEETSVVPPPEQDDDKEPGGASPEDVRARKEYRTRKTVERELQSERIEKIRLEERLRVLEQQRQPEPVKARVYTTDEVQAAIDGGQVTHAQAAAYFAKVEAERILDERDKRAKAQQPFDLAAREVNEYMAVLPWTRDQTSNEFQQVASVYRSLVNDYGLPDNIVTQRLALEKVAGPYQKIKDRMASDKATREARTNDAHAEIPAGGPPPSKGNDISQAPAHMVAVWNKTGTSPANRAKEYAYWKASRK